MIKLKAKTTEKFEKYEAILLDFLDYYKLVVISIVLILVGLLIFYIKFNPNDNAIIRSSSEFKCLDCNTTLSIDDIKGAYCKHCGVEHNVNNVVLLKNGVCEKCLDIIDTDYYKYHAKDKGNILTYENSKEKYIKAIKEITQYENYSELLNDCERVDVKHQITWLVIAALCFAVSVFLSLMHCLNKLYN